MLQCGLGSFGKNVWVFLVTLECFDCFSYKQKTPISLSQQFVQFRKQPTGLPGKMCLDFCIKPPLILHWKSKDYFCFHWTVSSVRKDTQSLFGTATASIGTLKVTQCKHAICRGKKQTETKPRTTNSSGTSIAAASSTEQLNKNKGKAATKTKSPSEELHVKATPTSPAPQPEVKPPSPAPAKVKVSSTLVPGPGGQSRKSPGGAAWSTQAQ